MSWVTWGIVSPSVLAVARTLPFQSLVTEYWIAVSETSLGQYNSPSRPRSPAGDAIVRRLGYSIARNSAANFSKIAQSADVTCSRARVRRCDGTVRA